MKKLYLSLFTFFLAFYSCDRSPDKALNQSPNIIIIYADDLGYGDLSCYGATGVETPNIDKIAEEGVRFTDAHSTAATCTPSRYSLLTGNYPFRSQAKILPGDAPLFIDPETYTLPDMLKHAGYTTAVIGKWHLGLGTGQVNWNAEVKPGPLELGFDYSFLIPATNDRVPCVFLENHRVVGLSQNDSLFISFTDDPSGGNPFSLPTGLTHPEMLKMPADTQHSGAIINGVSRIGFMKGGRTAEWKDEDFADIFVQKAYSFMESNAENPFFMYFSFSDIHVPRLPHPRFKGESGMGPRGDAIVQMDWVVGKIVEKIHSLKLTNNTLIIFSSDNGPVLNDGYEDGAVELLGTHKPAGDFRGGKYSIFEAGHRMPTISYWPSVIKPGVNNALWSQVDIMASLAALTQTKIPEGQAKDSENMLSVVLGREEEGREYLLTEAFTFSLRWNNYKYIAPQTNNFDWIKERKGIEGGISDQPQLYNLIDDPGEQTNIAETHPDVLMKLEKELKLILD